MPFTLKDAEGNDVTLLTQQEQTEMITGAVSGHLKKALPTLVEAVSKDVTVKVTESLSATLNEYEERRKAENEEQQQKKPNEQKAVSISDSPEFKALSRQLDEEKKKGEKRDSELASERAKAQSDKLKQSTLDALVGAGFSDAKRASMARTQLIGEGRIAWDEANEKLLFTDDNGERLPLSDGVKTWSKSEDAKIFLPPRGAGGSGGAAGQSGRNGSTGNDTATEAAAALRTVFGIG